MSHEEELDLHVKKMLMKDECVNEMKNVVEPTGAYPDDEDPFSYKEKIKTLLEEEVIDMKTLPVLSLYKFQILPRKV